jgi:single-strand DNA-binding protein
MNNLRNKVTLIGRVGQKPELQTVKGDFKVTKFSLATNENYKEKDGTWKENTQWHNIIAWGKTAEMLVKLSDKGVEIAMEGKLVNRNYESKTGEKHYVTEIELLEFILLNQKDKSKAKA